MDIYAKKALWNNIQKPNKIILKKLYRIMYEKPSSIVRINLRYTWIEKKKGA